MILPWEEAFELGEPSMDATHREFVSLLNRLDKIPNDAFPEYFDELLEHTRAHFEEENARMESSRRSRSHPRRNDADAALRCQGNGQNSPKLCQGKTPRLVQGPCGKHGHRPGHFFTAKLIFYSLLIRNKSK